MPNVITYSALISACEKGTRAKEALNAFKAMQRQGLVANAISMTSLLLACSASGQ